MKQTKSKAKLAYEEAYDNAIKKARVWMKLQERIDALTAQLKEAKEVSMQANQEERFCELQVACEEYALMEQKILDLQGHFYFFTDDKLTPEQIALRDKLRTKYAEEIETGSKRFEQEQKKREENAALWADVRAGKYELVPRVAA